MSALSHTPEPWVASGNRIGVEIAPAMGFPDPQPAEYEQIGEFNTEVEAQRAVKCVNACAGIEDPAKALRLAREALEPFAKAWEALQDGTGSNPGEWRQVFRQGGGKPTVEISGADMVRACQALAALGVKP